MMKSGLLDADAWIKATWEKGGRFVNASRHGPMRNSLNTADADVQPPRDEDLGRDCGTPRRLRTASPHYFHSSYWLSRNKLCHATVRAVPPQPRLGPSLRNDHAR
jgi:hypothetical protein